MKKDRMEDFKTETFRHQCEVREIIAKRIAKGRGWAHDHLIGIEKVRGKKARQRLEADILQQWNLGNRGKHGVWLVPDVA